MRKRRRNALLVTVTLLVLALLPLAGSAQEGETWRVLDPPLSAVTLPETPEASDFWNLMQREDLPPDRDVDTPGTALAAPGGPYINETVFNQENYTLTYELCGFTPETPLEPLITLPDGSFYNDAATLSRLGLWAEAAALPEDVNGGTCVVVVQQIGIGSTLDGEYTVSYFDPIWGEIQHTWTLTSPRLRTVVAGPRGLEYDPGTQAAWILLGFSPEDALRVAVYHRYDTTEPASDAASADGEEAYPLGWHEFRGEVEVVTDEFGEAALVVTVPEPLLETINPENLALVIWSENSGFWGYNYYPIPGVARVLIGEGRTLDLRQARQSDAPELARLQNNEVVQFVTEEGEQFRVSTLSGLEGWVHYNWVMPLFGVEAEAE